MHVRGGWMHKCNGLYYVWHLATCVESEVCTMCRRRDWRGREEGRYLNVLHHWRIKNIFKYKFLEELLAKYLPSLFLIYCKGIICEQCAGQTVCYNHVPVLLSANGLYHNKYVVLCAVRAVCNMHCLHFIRLPFIFTSSIIIKAW
jgi:hypothetical protein